MSIFRNIIKWTMAITLIAIIIAAFINLVVVSRSAKRTVPMGTTANLSSKTTAQ